MKIRQATIEDARAIARVQVETWRSAYGGIVAETIRWLEILKQSATTFVAEADEIVGFANGGPARECEQLTVEGLV